VVGWYTIGAAPTPADVAIHEQFVNANEAGPSFFVLFNPDIPEGTKTLPFSVYEAALEGESSTGKFVRLDCGIETGEAERIAVDGVTKDGSGEADQTGEVASLTMQRNAIAMLYDRALVLLKYVSGVVDGELREAVCMS
jgi:COP9 signalosome complex subunit 6